MRFDPSKAWPHPVLRPPRYGDDYPHAEFEVEIEFTRSEGSTAVEIQAEFQLSEPSLLKLVDEGSGKYVLLIKASRTHFRELIESNGVCLQKSYPAGALAGRVEFAPFLVSTKDLKGFSAEGWHVDFLGRAFDISAGSVLAEDEPKDYWVDTADEAPLGSIFGHKPSSDLTDGRWICELAEERVWIVMSNTDSARYMAARDRVNNRPDGQYLMNGVYLPALVAVLNEVDGNVEDFQDYRWFAFLDQRLSDVGCSPLGSANANRLVDAQIILDSPFPKMSLIAREGE